MPMPDRRLASHAASLAMAIAVLAFAAPAAEAKRFRALPGTGKTAVPTAGAKPSTARPAAAAPALAPRAAPQPAAAAASGVGARPVVFFGIGSAQASPASASEDPAAAARRTAAAAAPRLAAPSAPAPNPDARLLPMMGFGGGDTRPVKGFESLN